MNKALLADLLAVAHLTYFLFIVLGQVTILTGMALRWQWVRNFTFRTLHLAAMLLVGVEAVFQVKCPVTVWERQLRYEAGQTVSEASFMARLANAVLFHSFPEWVFNVAHIAFALLVITTFVFCPPQWPRWLSRRKTGSAGKIGSSPLPN
jgi:hypothetical protein